MALQNKMTKTILVFVVLAAGMCLVESAPQNKKQAVRVHVPTKQEAPGVKATGIQTKQLNLERNIHQFVDVFDNTVGSCRDFLSDCVDQRGCDYENGCRILQSTVARTCCKCFLECAAAGDFYTAGKCSGWAKDRGVTSCFST